MKTLNFKTEGIIILLTIVTLLQSCTVYKNHPVSAEKAAASNSSVAATDIHGRSHKFKRLYFENEKLFGVAKRESKTAGDLAQWIESDPNDPDSKFVNILIDETKIKRFNPKDKFSSYFFPALLVLVAIPLGVVAAGGLEWGN